MEYNVTNKEQEAQLMLTNPSDAMLDYYVIGSVGLRYIFCNVIIQNFPSSLSQPGSAVTHGH